MDAEFEDIANVLKDKKLQLPKLNVLVPDSCLYQVLAIQCGGKIETKEDFIGHLDRSTATKKFSNLLGLAVEKDCDLVLSPEYSCPWKALEEAITQNLLPKMGKIWILGCESITPTRLSKITSEFPNVIWIHESVPTGTGKFLDVLAYVTSAKTTTGEEKHVIVLQFKTQPMGGDPFERDHLICGKTIYFWHNPKDSIRLISLICSEAIGFDQNSANKCDIDNHPHLIVHLQLTDNPRHQAISSYRRQLFGQKAGDNIEVLALNWARGFTLPNKQQSAYGGSAIYTKSLKFVSSDTRLEENHKKGLYYSYWSTQHTELCLLSFDESVLHFRMPKTRIDGSAALCQRTGPEMISICKWDTGKESWLNSDNTDDGFAELCETFQQPTCDYCLDPSITTIDRERLFSISSGSLKPSKDWHEVRHMNSYIAEADERSKRLHFTHEKAPDSVQFRNDHLARYIELQQIILTTPGNFPNIIKDLTTDWKLAPPHKSNGFRFNLISRSGLASAATAIFLGPVPPQHARQLADAIVEAWDRVATRRLVIWYRTLNTTSNTYAHITQELPSITDDSDTPTSFTRPVRP